MGHWLTHDSEGGAESPGLVLERIRERLLHIFYSSARIAGQTAHWILVTHSGTMRVLLREAFGEDPGEPDFCEIISLEDIGQAGLAKLTHRGRTAFLRLVAP
jgi:broad specificity phosphatase PhoE